MTFPKLHSQEQDSNPAFQIPRLETREEAECGDSNQVAQFSTSTVFLHLS